MGISVEGQKCPVCDAYLFDNDDLVFCPECGAPHHRDCYAALGHCAFEDKHGTDEGYKPVKVEQDSLSQEEVKIEDAVKTCRFCGEQLEPNEKVCHKCGKLQMAGQPFGATVIIDPMGGVKPDDDIDGVTAKEVRLFVGANAQRYIPRFKAMAEKKKGSWNWAAFLVPHVWFFYRKMPLPGILFSSLLLVASMLLLPLAAIINTFPEQATASTAVLAKYLVDNLSSINSLSLFLAFLSTVLEIGIRIAAGFMGDKIYKKTVISGIKKVKKSDDNSLPLELALAKKGGVNVFLGLIGLLAFDLILEWVSAFYIML
ncbi:MAG: DUF2628 domain-containing protein [Ruminococcaceae bacterium]|nr:DUF2628 domain-containing protein [Oscillospiraceae bacterium]